ncbi:serine hydrolase [Modestobacter sp. VKM Ac-2977]|uniref:serine hydrolase n=1 Tax=Modestobacter sp. VKM Ac-2977 TaxID=3004131 RepID=UPI0022A9F8B9|nr:serine hydrolase [Modestobacter sp. VKM Ac-2977]MCZ2822325.1 serine hydrolase [Modestobacter sp. VKM Ac-2977]
MSGTARRWGATLLVVLAAVVLLAGATATPARAEMHGAVAEATAYTQARGEEVGIAVLDRETGQWSVNGAAHTRMRSASILKVFVAESLLDRSRRGAITLTHDDRVLLEAMVIRSDDGAMSNLYSRFGGLGMVHAVTAKYGLTEIGDPPSAGYWGMFQITAHDIVKFYAGVLDGGLQPADRDHLVSLMRRATPTGADGIDQFFGIPRALPGQVWGVKQGWMCCQEGKRRLHTTGILGADNRFLVAVLSQGPQTRSYAYFGETLTRVVQVLFPGGVVPSRDVPRNPFGNLEVATEVSPGVVRVGGWAADSDGPSWPLDVHVYLDGNFAGQASAGLDRPDIPAAFPGYSAARGFSLDLRVEEGVHRLCVNAINVGRGTDNPELGCRTFTVRLSPLGNLDSGHPQGLRAVQVHGWTMDPEAPGTPTDVHLYVDGRLASGANAAGDRPDVAAAYPGTGAAHGFATLVPLPAPGRHEVCAYAINVPGTGGVNPQLGCATVDAPAAMLGHLDWATPQGGLVALSGWAMDPLRPGSTVEVHVYSDGGWVTATTAGGPRPDVESVYPEGGPTHGFSVSAALPPGQHRVCAYAIYRDGRAGNPELGCHTVG